MKLKHQLALTLVGLAAAALLVSLLLVYLVFRDDQLRALDAVVLPRARAAARVRPSAIRLLEPRSVVVYGPNRRPLAFTKVFKQGPPAWSDLDVQEPIPPEGITLDLPLHGRPHRAALVPSPHQGQVVLYVAPRRLLDRTLGFMSRLFLLLLGGALVVTTVVAWWLGGRLARDVAVIATVSRSVAAGDLSARIPGSRGGSSEIRDLRSDLNKMIASLDSLVTAQQTFVAHAAHELRSPLTALRGELELALRRERTPEQYRRTLTTVLEEIQLLSSLAEDLLLLARVQGRTTTPGVAALATVVRQAVRRARAIAESRGVVFAVPDDAQLQDSLWVDAADATRALRNLLDNAVVHADAGTTVTLSVSSHPGRVSIAVMDHGPGVDAADVPHLFTPFYRGAQANATPGAGLGLTIAREIARAYGGDLVLDPAYQEGARFVLELPRATSGSAQSRG